MTYNLQTTKQILSTQTNKQISQLKQITSTIIQTITSKTSNPTKQDFLQLTNILFTYPNQQQLNFFSQLSYFIYSNQIAL